ncbi:hypothetical protein SAMN05421837_103322 [Amycolatopsis pretoriensis]|uniref:PH domain-containing protein n=1 Tax=Amycolatopsis pretoriensis TaxID=218821 RepID=A0A1H5QK08_9PSEU|nr:hypothetical protein [Amycolatopsis pretoriensis]SEF26450.1 hypothetical protein SAMN05421837_103322 [Amycolatopsis pretoriensis]
MGEPIIVLEPGERLLWSGRPRRVVPTGWEWCRLGFGSVLVSVVFAALGATFLFLATLGFAVVWGPVLWRLWTTHRAVYAVTDQRVVVADRVSGHTRKWMDLTTPAVTSLRRDGLGTLTFHPLVETIDVLGFGLPKKNQPLPIVLSAVPDAEGVRELIAHAQA